MTELTANSENINLERKMLYGAEGCARSFVGSVTQVLFQPSLVNFSSPSCVNNTTMLYTSFLLEKYGAITKCTIE